MLGVGMFGSEMSLLLPGYSLVAFFLCAVCLSAGQAVRQIPSEKQEGQIHRTGGTRQEEGSHSSPPR